MKNVFIYEFIYEFTCVNMNSYMNSYHDINKNSWTGHFFVPNHMFFS